MKRTIGAQVRAAKPVSDRATRYMQDGSILPWVSTSCDDLQRRITKSPRNVRRAGAAFTLASSCLAFASRPISEKSGPDFIRAKGAVVERFSIDAKRSAQTDLDLECSRYCSSSRRETHCEGPRDRPRRREELFSARLANCVRQISWPGFKIP